jgi:hypothetical protein
LNCPRNCNELREVEAPLAELVFRDEGLRPFQTVGEILLRKARVSRGPSAWRSVEQRAIQLLTAVLI